uniref:Uncharacterized protein n=2 Tax=Bird gammacoronavirus AnasCN24 TaxID=3237959 RepID=A0AB39ACM8_9GAMC
MLSHLKKFVKAVFSSYKCVLLFNLRLLDSVLLAHGPSTILTKLKYFFIFQVGLIQRLLYTPPQSLVCYALCSHSSSF